MEPAGNGGKLPKRIVRLGELITNMWWTWQPDAQRLFERLDPVRWEEVRHNPVALLRRVERARLNAAVQTPAYLELYDRVMEEFDRALTGPTWFARAYPERAEAIVAYFSTEFGIHEAFPAYAGGLGVLAGDFLKEASDLGLPMVGVGLLYQHGYFTQRITEDGWQEAIYEPLDLENLPLHPVLGPDGQPVRVEVTIAGRPVRAQIWRLQIGRIPLYLLDTSLPENEPADRELSARLYDGDPERRIAQEMILGIGGVRALRALGLQPAVWHLNEGHSAFSILERLREHIAAGLPFEEAAARVRATTVFTTHTPVPAGHDRFSLSLIERAFAGYWEQLGLSFKDFCELARQDEPWGSTFNMTVLALRFADHRNAVSELHGHVTRKMWAHLWPDRPVEAVPIRHITNGVHVGTWLARRMRVLYQRYLGPDWLERLDDPTLWERVLEIPDEELWTVRRHLKRKLVAFMRERARRRWQGNRVSPIQIVASGVLLDPYALTIGFARRFALYKRAYLLFRDPERLRRLINDPYRPVQIILAGKAHPADEPAKRMIQEIYRLIKDPAFGGRIAFLEDYDIEVARHLVQGVDVWLNTPAGPLEASGTSGQKAALNGVLNLSVLDGWWREGYNGANGWAIGEDREYEDPEAQDAADAASLYDLLEKAVVPLYYDVEADGIPHRWLRMVKESIRSLAPFFNTRRMVKEYLQEMYLPAMEAASPADVAGVKAMSAAMKPETRIHALSIREAIAWASRRVRASAPRLAAEVLLAHVLNVSRAYLLAHPERTLAPDEWEAFARLVARSEQGEPLFYLIGEREFYGMPFKVTPAVLIPRPETEGLVDAALEWARSRAYRTYAPLVFADIGTGSGCIAVALAVYLPNSRGYATDLSPEALEVAQENAARHGVASRLTFLQGDLCAPLPEPVDLLVANLPYVARSEWADLDPAIREYEPILALDGGPDGLDLIRRFLAQAPGYLRPMGAVFLEIGAGQGPAVLTLARAAFPRAVIRLLKDAAGLDRIVAITH